MRYENPLKILEIMRLLEEQGLSHREIASSVNCGKTTVSEIKRRCREAGLTYKEAQAMSYAEIKDALYPKLAQLKVKADPDWSDIHARLEKHPRLNLQFIWTEEYRPSNPDGLSYSQFCRRYAQWCKKSGQKVVMHREHEPGKEMFVDWAGDTLDVVCDVETGEMCTAHFFITALGDSGYPYVEAFPDEKEGNWLTGHVHAFEWYGGVPRIVVPDNTKTAVTKATRYDPVFNPSYVELVKHYRVAIIPARPRKPRDKSVVEGSVGWLETWLLEWLRGKRFFGFDELNREIRKRVSKLTLNNYKKRPGSRQSVFETVDKPALGPLPAARYEYIEYARRRVPDNYHVEYDGFYYSVPYTLFKEWVVIRASQTVIEVLGDDGRRVAFHVRHFSGRKYVTADEHMPENHRRQRAFDRRDGNSYRSWANNIGENTYHFIDELLKAQTVEETAYRSCMGVLQMGNRYGNEELERICTKALAMGSVTYSTVKRLMGASSCVNLIDAAPPLHDNLRDPSEFN